MARTNARRGWLVLMLVAAVCIAWMTWAWSPGALDDGSIASDAVEPVVAPAPQLAPAAKAVPPSAPALAPAPPAAPAPPDDTPPEQPERIPTPHLMSLDQTKPPEQQGALSELKNQYESESRSAESSANEAKLRQLVTDSPTVPSELVQGISCRRTVCKIEMHWTARRRIGFAVVLGSFKQLYEQRVAVEPAQGRAPDGTHLTTLYLRLRP